MKTMREPRRVGSFDQQVFFGATGEAATDSLDRRHAVARRAQIGLSQRHTVASDRFADGADETAGSLGRGLDRLRFGLWRQADLPPSDMVDVPKFPSADLNRRERLSCKAGTVVTP